MPPCSPEPPKPAFAENVNLGLIVDAPMLHQVQPPNVLNTTVVSTLLGSTVTGTTIYTYQKQRELVRSVFESADAQKTTEFFYTPVDLTPRLVQVEQKQAEAEATLRQTKDKAARAALKRQLKDLKAAVKDLRDRKRKGMMMSQLVRSTFEEEAEGMDGPTKVTGETTFEYDGGDIVKSTTRSTSSDDPDRIDEVITGYTYDAAGRLATKECYGQITSFQFDPFGRIAWQGGRFEAPDGTFSAEYETTYTYAPPNSEPAMPSNGLFMTISTAKSGPVKLEAALGLFGPPDLPEPSASEGASGLPGVPEPLEPPPPPDPDDPPPGPIDLDAANAVRAGVDVGTALLEHDDDTGESATAPAPPPPPPPPPDAPDLTTVTGIYVYAS